MNDKVGADGEAPGTMNRPASGTGKTGRRVSVLSAALGLVLALALLAGGMTPAYADDIGEIPQRPHGFAGNVSVLDPPGPVPAGVRVEAFLDGTKISETTVGAGGKYVFLVPGPGNNVTFRVWGVMANEWAIWEEATLEEPFNLTIDELPEFELTVASTAGGSVTKPGEGTFPYLGGTAVDLMASANKGYQFDRWTGNVTTVGNVTAAATSITIIDDYAIVAEFKVKPDPPPPSPPSPPGVICFIATAAYGSPTAGEIDVLREFRDTVLLANRAGAGFVSFYYKTGPFVAGFISRHDFLRTGVRVGLLDPVVTLLNWSHDLWSERRD